jgi:hypothetical protein
MMGADMVTKHLGDGKTTAFGCLCSTNAVGGINIHAVDAACQMGAKVIYMPTVSAKNHIDHHKSSKFVGAGDMKIPEKPIYYLDDEGSLKNEVVEVLEYLAKYQPDVVLGTGHGSAAEINKLIDKAVELGIKKIIATHPFFKTDATMDDIVRWADKGALIELNAVVYDDVVPASYHLPITVIQDALKYVGYERIVVDSDLGQANFMSPVEGLLKFAQVLKDLCGVTDEQLVVMMSKNPAQLLGPEVADNKN